MTNGGASMRLVQDSEECGLAELCRGSETIPDSAPALMISQASDVGSIPIARSINPVSL